MQLDRTHVVIRLRSLSEIGDLAMVMVRRYPSSLLIGLSIGASVWAIANALLLSWIPIREAAYGLNDEEAITEVARYMAWMALLVMLQAPAAGVLTTRYLGQAVFEHRPTWSNVYQQVKRKFWRWFWVLGWKRMAVPAMILMAFRWGQPFDAFFDVAVPFVICLAAAFVRSVRPFAPEILILEQCPLKRRSTSNNEISMKQRSQALHTPMAGELASRFIVVSFALFGVLLSVFYTLMWIRGIAFGIWSFMDLVVLLVLYPMALWTVAGISTIVRLLCYLDTRIRLEGWEVELAIKAEAMRQFGDEWTPIASPQRRVASGPAKGAEESGQQQQVLEAVHVVAPKETNR
jgi:hypothetical protein